MNFYGEPGPYRLNQGDLLYPIYFSGYGVGPVNRYDNDAQKIVHADLSSDELDTGLIVVGVKKSWGMVVTQGCDLDSEFNLVVARIRPIDEVFKLKGATPEAKAIEALKSFSNAGKAPRHFYLPAVQCGKFSISNSVACLLESQSFTKDSHAALSKLRRASLSPDALTMLQEKLAYCFCRFGAPEHLCYNTEAEWATYKSSVKGRTLPEPNDFPTRNHAHKSTSVVKVQSNSWLSRLIGR